MKAAIKMLTLDTANGTMTKEGAAPDGRDVDVDVPEGARSVAVARVPVATIMSGFVALVEEAPHVLLK